MNETVEIWLHRAESAYKLGALNKAEGIYYEDLCFQLQQACEKALKALIIHYNQEPKKTHSFQILIQQIEDYISVPTEIRNAISLNNYAVQTRYPGDYEPVDSEEYEEALSITGLVIKWVKSQIK